MRLGRSSMGRPSTSPLTLSEVENNGGGGM